MDAYSLLIVLALYGLYCLAILGLIVFLRKLGISVKLVVVLSLLIFAIAVGFASIGTWTKDISVLLNLPAVIVGDIVYQWSILVFGDASSFQAHYTIPWILRVPQVYMLTSIVLWGVVGFLVQLVYNKWSR